jgi:DMSO/TMAO reductase YedYZ molybdopterin-dependent catalytic subunit
MRRRLFRQHRHGVGPAPADDHGRQFADATLPQKFGYPFKVRIPTKLGYKNPKWVTTIFVTNRMPGGFWEDRGYNWFGGS